MPFDGLRQYIAVWVDERRPPALPLPAGWEILLVDDDDEEEAGPREDAETGRTDIAGMAFLIRYRDVKGRDSQRRITVRRVWLDGSDYSIQAWCHEREATRVFKASRVVEMVELDTGEIMGDAVQFLAQHVVVGKAPQRRPNPARAALSRCADGLNVLAYLARADGVVHAAEQSQMVDYVMANAAAGTSKKLVERGVARVWPDRVTFLESLDRLLGRGTPDQLADLFMRLVALVEADGELSPGEFELLSEIRSAALGAGVAVTG